MYDKLKIFQVVASSDTFSSAAKKLRRTQPAVSQQIALLEAELGFRLFERRRNRAFLSPQGQALLEIIAVSFDRIDSKIIALREDLGQVEGRIRVGFLLDYSTSFDLASTLVGFSAKHPKVDFTIAMGTNDEIEAMLVAGDIDLGISIVFRDKSAFHRQFIVESKHILVCGDELHKSLNKKSMERIFSESRLIDFSEDFLCLSPWLKKNAPEALTILRQKRPSAIVPNHQEALKIVMKQWGIAIIPEHLCIEHLNAGLLKKIRPNSQELTVGLDIAFLRRRTLRQSERLFVDYVVPGSV